jgi:hypothetical protein
MAAAEDENKLNNLDELRPAGSRRWKEVRHHWRAPGAHER